MATLDAFLEAITALFASAFGLLILAGGVGRRPNRALAAFLFLIAANQLIEALRSNVPAIREIPFVAYLAVVASLLDPLALLLFSRAYLGAASPRSRWVAALASLAAAALMAFSAAVILRHGSVDDVSRMRTLISTYTAIVYVVVLARFQRSVGARPLPSSLWLIPALVITSLPAMGRAASDIGWLLSDPTLLPVGNRTYVGTVAAVTIVVLAAAATLLAARRGLDPRVARSLRYGVALAVGVFLLGQLFGLAGVLGLGSDHPWLVSLGRAGAAVRWLLFSALCSVAFVRHGDLDLRPFVRRLAARVLVALAMTLAIYEALVLLDRSFAAGDQPLSRFEIALVIALVALSQAFHTFIDRIARIVYGMEFRDATDENLRIYQEAARRAIEAGRAPARDESLAELRKELGIRPASTDVLHRLAEEDAYRYLRPGLLVMGRYRVEAVLGEGAHARVHAAYDETLGRRVSLKEILAGDQGADIALREARAASMVPHPNVVTIHDVFRRGHVNVLVMELAEGGSLASRLEREGRYGHRGGLRVLDEILAGLAAAHAAGVIHRDLKPSNVLLDGGGHAKVGDFGISRLSQGHTLAFGHGSIVVGTPGFLAPEQLDGEPASERSDIYAAARLARQMLPERLPPEIERVLAQAEARVPSERWASAAQMREALAKAAAAPSSPED